MEEKKNKSEVARRAWRILRLALLWTRKGGVFRKRIAMEFNLFPKFIKTLAHSNSSRRRAAAIHYVGGERELSFDKTPIIHVRMHRPSSSMRFRMPHIPCLNPEVEFDFDDYEFNDDCLSYCNNNNNDGGRKSFLIEYGGGGDEDDEEVVVDYDGDDESGGCDDGIDLKAERFIADFYEQLKIQRQISCLK